MVEVRRWNNKRKRRLARLDAIKALDAFPRQVAMDATHNIVRTMVAHAKDEQRRKDIERLKGLIGGLEGIALGPVGQAQLEAYQTAIEVIDAVRWIPPVEVQSRWVQRAMAGIR